MTHVYCSHPRRLDWLSYIPLHQAYACMISHQIQGVIGNWAAKKLIIVSTPKLPRPYGLGSIIKIILGGI